MSEQRNCNIIREWLTRQPLLDNPQVTAASSGPSLAWDEWIDQGRNTPDTETCLLQFLENEQDPFRRSNIVMALGYVGSDQSAPRLIELLQDQEPMVVTEAAAALGRIGTQQIVPYLIELLKRDDPNVRANACQALGMLGGDEATTALNGALSDEDLFVRTAAQHALTRSALE